LVVGSRAQLAGWPGWTHGGYRLSLRNIYPRAGWWVLRYRDDVLEGGELVRKQLAKQLAQIKPEHARLKRAPAEVEKMGADFLHPLNNGETNPQSTQTIGQFVENYFFPRLEHEIRGLSWPMALTTKTALRE
jgi:hypothetical protein